MKKILGLLLVVCFLVMPMVCYGQGDSHAQIIYTEVIDSGATALSTAIPVTKIRPEVDKILGMEVMALTTSTVVAALWDSASTVIASTEMICEFEATSYYAGGAFFPFPRWIVNGIVVHQDAQSRVIIYYVRQ